MEDVTSGNEDLLLLKLKALARRGATLRQARDGVGEIDGVGRARPSTIVAPGEVQQMLAAGWLRLAGEHVFVLSRRGIARLRNMLNRPAQTGGATPRVVPISASLKPARPLPRSQATRPSTNDRESPLAWLRQRRDKDGKAMIGDNEYLAGERLGADFERASLSPRITASWNPAALPSGGSRGAPGTGLELGEGVVAARQRVDAALQAVGPELSGMLLDVCCFLKGLEQAERNGDWPRRAGKVVLQLGLAHLARHCGFTPPELSGTPNIRSWGMPDYRPQIDSTDVT